MMTLVEKGGKKCGVVPPENVSIHLKLFQIESEMMKDHVIEGWSGQVGEKKEVSYNRAVCVCGLGGGGGGGGGDKNEVIYKRQFHDFHEKSCFRACVTRIQSG